MKLGTLLQLSGLGCAAIFFLFLLKTGVRNLWRGLASRNWPTTEAVVTNVERSVTTHRQPDQRGSYTTHAAKLTLAYNISGKAHTTDQVCWGQTLGTSDASEATLIALRYPEGRHLMVHYNPARPTEAVVKAGLTSSAFWLPAIALAFLALLTAGGIWVWRLPVDGFPSGPTWLIRATCLLPVLLGVALILIGINNLILARRSLKWPTVEGQWLRQPVLAENADADARAAAANPKDPGLHYVYRYDVKGQTHFNNVRTFGQGSVDKNGADAEITRLFPRDRWLKVAYSPEDPDVAVLRPGIRLQTWLLPALGVIFCVFGAVGMFLMTGSKPAAVL